MNLIHCGPNAPLNLGWEGNPAEYKMIKGHEFLCSICWINYFSLLRTQTCTSYPDLHTRAPHFWYQMSWECYRGSNICFYITKSEKIKLASSVLKKKKSLFLFCFLFFRVIPMAYGSFQARVEMELQLPAYTTATATQDLSHVCNPHHSSRQLPDT